MRQKKTEIQGEHTCNPCQSLFSAEATPTIRHGVVQHWSCPTSPREGASMICESVDAHMLAIPEFGQPEPLSSSMHVM